MTVYVYREGQGMVPKAQARRIDGPSFMPDIAPFISPIDGTEITSRSAVREHEKRHNVYQTGNDWSGSAKPSWWPR